MTFTCALGCQRYGINGTANLQWQGKSRESTDLMTHLPMKVFQLLSRLRRGKTLGVRVAAIDGDGRVMLVRHGYVKGWALPGGGVERGETLRQAALRELHEETGIVATGPLQLHGFYSNHVAFPGDHVGLFILREFRLTPFTPGFEIREAKFFGQIEMPADISAGTSARLEEIFNGATVSEHWNA